MTERTIVSNIKEYMKIIRSIKYNDFVQRYIINYLKKNWLWNNIPYKIYGGVQFFFPKKRDKRYTSIYEVWSIISDNRNLLE